eukprot:6186320-Prorocentrum_lima.AAC.1
MAEYGNLPLKSLDSTVNIRFVQCTATVANQIAGGEIIASVNDNIIFCNQPAGILRTETKGVGKDVHLTVQSLQPLGGT